MKWSEVMAAFPDRWVVVEMLERRRAGEREYWDSVAVVTLPASRDEGDRVASSLGCANAGRGYACFHTGIHLALVRAARVEPPPATAMTWSEVRAAWPDRWVVVEVRRSHEDRGWLEWDDLAVLGLCADSGDAMRREHELRRAHSGRVLHAIHTRWQVARFELVGAGGSGLVGDDEARAAP